MLPSSGFLHSTEYQSRCHARKDSALTCSMARKKYCNTSNPSHHHIIRNPVAPSVLPRHIVAVFLCCRTHSVTIIIIITSIIILLFKPGHISLAATKCRIRGTHRPLNSLLRGAGSPISLHHPQGLLLRNSSRSTKNNSTVHKKSNRDSHMNSYLTPIVSLSTTRQILFSLLLLLQTQR